MALSERKNRGEWSELYALVYILATGEIISNSSSQKSDSPAFPVVSVSRRINGVVHEFRIADSVVEVLDTSNHQVRTTISRTELARQSKLLLSKIKLGKGRAFAIPEAKSIMSALGLDKVTGNTEKTDLTITIYDSRVNQEISQGFSIKSFMGANPTLFNASGVTNIEYTVERNLTESQTNELNKLGPRKIVTTLIGNGYKLVPYKIDIRFVENLKMIDSEMDSLVAQIVLASFRGKGRSMQDIVNILVENNPLNYSSTNSKSRYTHKLKDLLEAVALGMRPAKPWAGRAEAKGGNLIVTSAGELLCHHALDKDSLRDYLFDNTAIDTPSRKTHKFGSIIDNRLTLNFQIRFR